MSRPLIGLALGSGIARGWAHIGVLRALDEIGVRPDIVCGTSIGALVGGAYLAGKLDVLEDWTGKLQRTSIFRYLDLQLGGGGLVKGTRLAKLMSDTLGDVRIEDLPAAYASVTTELGTGHEIWLRKGRLINAINASYALPGVFPPVKVDGRWLVDGALTNPVPVSVCRALGARLVIAVNLNADLFGKSKLNGSGESFEEWEKASLRGALAGQPINMLKQQFFGKGDHAPSVFSVMVGALNIVQDRLSRSRLAGDPPDVVVAPQLGGFGLLEFDKAAPMIEEGRAAVARARPFLDQALKVLDH